MTMHPSLAVHPGDWLKSEVVDPHGVSINRLEARVRLQKGVRGPPSARLSLVL